MEDLAQQNGQWATFTDAMARAVLARQQSSNAEVANCEARRRSGYCNCFIARSPQRCQSAVNCEDGPSFSTTKNNVSSETGDGFSICLT